MRVPGRMIRAGYQFEVMTDPHRRLLKSAPVAAQAGSLEVISVQHHDLEV